VKRRVGRHSIELSRLDKPLWPEGITKGDLVDYYQEIAPKMIPLVRERLMTLERFPDGIESTRFYSKQAPKYFPSWIARKSVPKSGGKVNHVVCNEAATLVYLANQACITLHTGLSRIDRVEYPDQMIFDLDPSGDFEIVRTTAVELRELLDDLGLVAFVKTSGSKGLHVTVPLDRKAHFRDVRSFTNVVAAALVERRPDELTLEIRKEKRAGRLLLDVGRNAFGAHAVAPYTVRARPGGPVAATLDWSEINDPDFHPQQFSMADAVKRSEPWKGWRRHARSLTHAIARIERISRYGLNGGSRKS
jgi:bifunctional non-homologous end joining protein LigD